jgi:hypothetical protein
MYYCPKSELQINEVQTKYLATDGDVVSMLFQTNNRKIKYVKGDFAIPEEDDAVPYKQPASPKVLRPRVKQSLFNELAGVDIGIIKERELTPPQKTLPEDNNTIKRTNSFNKENIEKLRHSNTLHKSFNIKTNKDSIIRVPEGCIYFLILDATDDHDLKILIDHINEEPVKTNGWNQVINDKGLAIFKKTVYP